MRNAIDTVIIKFLTKNILSRFGCPRRLVIHNAQSFKSKKLVNFCPNHNITLSHSTPYYPQGHGLAESSNKSLVRIIKKLLSKNKKNWDSKLVYAMWADRISSKKSIGTSPFQLVYGVEAVILFQLALPVMKLFQDEVEEPNLAQRRMLQMIELNQVQEAIVEKTQVYKYKVMSIFDKRENQNNFQVDDLVLQWDVRRQDRGKHGKFDKLWFGPFKVFVVLDNNTFLLENLYDNHSVGGPVNGHFIKHFFLY